MADIMRPLAFTELINRITGEYAVSKSVFGMGEEQFYRKADDRTYKVFGESCETPLGPAAGPHTQLAQNIVTSFLSGARFIELKTVQILDTLEIDKPCIDCRDECYNTEWSSEFTVPKAFDEYLKAWFLLHLLEEIFSLRKGRGRSFLFNMSVGYDLEGIKSPKVDGFIESLKDASAHPLFARYRHELKDAIEGNPDWADMKGLEERISPNICSQLTLSTMHGCPPEEIEQIARYMLTEKKLNIFVKLNPTLLGYDFVTGLLGKAGYELTELSPEAFSHDLAWEDAVPMLHRLKDLAASKGRLFGVKLTNTLGTVNKQGVLPGDEMYMSGRSLYPLSLNVAARISREFDGALPISFSGGLNRFNMEDVLATGIGPATAATDFLKPGGYMRMADLARFIENLPLSSRDKIDVEALEALADKSLEGDNPALLKRSRGYEKVSVPGGLPAFDCFVAPCKLACPIHQDIPEYIQLTSAGKYKEAAALIYQKNPLPHITGHICAHQCQYDCTRRDYESPVEIREMKKIALDLGFEDYKKDLKPAVKKDSPRTAVIGAGPAGLAAASYLARVGLPVTIIDENEIAGGVVEHNIPDFRIPRKTIEKDVDFVKSLGVEFRLGEKWDFNLETLKAEGYDYVMIGAGADRIRSVRLAGDLSRVLPSFEFINRFNKDRASLKLGRHVVVVGAGDTAMDSCRSALRLEGVKTVTLAYRRSERQMPATPEEYEDCLSEDIEFRWLRNPERINEDGTVTLRIMELGEPDESGRRRPVATDKTEIIPCDTLIPSIGETVDWDEMEPAGFARDDRGRVITDGNNETNVPGIYLIGDGRTGPSTIVGAMADARRAVDALLEKESITEEPPAPFQRPPADLIHKKIAHRKGIVKKAPDRKADYDREAFAREEAERCLKCHVICQKCVDVCPNRANVPIAVEGMSNANQILHLDAYCNECGNCATFCPWDGKPYKDKPTLFSRREDLENSDNDGFFIDKDLLHVRWEGIMYWGQITDDGRCKGQLPESNSLRKLIAAVYTNHSYLLGPVED